ncbi:MAG TPA: hypothetical protein VHC95_06000 [Opitutales bacterium]|nr:hypothetical protein [Opitutales bacterium]
MSQDTVPAEDNRKLISPLGHVIILASTAVFFVIMTGVLMSHTPDFSEHGKLISAAYTSVCITGVFWITFNCFWVTVVDQHRRKKAGIKS